MRNVRSRIARIQHGVHSRIARIQHGVPAIINPLTCRGVTEPVFCLQLSSEWKKAKGVSAMKSRGRAATIVVSSFFVQVLTHGLSTSLGVLYGEWKKDFNEQAALISWLATSMFSVLLGTSPIAGALTRHLGIRPVMAFGGILAASGTLAASFAEDVTILFITIPFMAGFGSSLAYTSAVVSVANSFNRHYDVLNGLASAGAGMGMILWPILLQLLVDSYTWRGALMVLSGIQLNLVPLALLLTHWSGTESSEHATMKHQDTTMTSLGSPTADKECTITCQQGSSYDDAPNGMVEADENVGSNSGDVSKTRENVVTFVIDDTDSSHEEGKNLDTDGDVENEADSVGERNQVLEDAYYPDTTTALMEMETTTVGNSARSRFTNSARRNSMVVARSLKTSLVHSTGLSLLWENRVFALLLPSFVLAGGAAGTFLPHAKSVAMANGIPPFEAAFLYSVIGIANTTARATHGLLLKTGHVHQIHLFAASYFLGAVCALVLPSTGSYAVMVLCSAGLGSAMGTYIPLQIVVLRHIVPLDRFPGAFGITLLCVCIGIMTSSLVSGYVLDQTGSYQLAFILGGCMGLCACVVLTLEHILWNYIIIDKRWPPKVNSYETPQEKLK